MRGHHCSLFFTRCSSASLKDWWTGCSQCCMSVPKTNLVILNVTEYLWWTDIESCKAFKWPYTGLKRFILFEMLPLVTAAGHMPPSSPPSAATGSYTLPFSLVLLICNCMTHFYRPPHTVRIRIHIIIQKLNIRIHEKLWISANMYLWISDVRIVFFFISNRIESNSWAIIWNFEWNRIVIVGFKSHQ